MSRISLARQPSSARGSWPAALRPMVRGLALPAVLLVAWQAICLAQLLPAYMLPSPAAVVERFGTELAGGTFRQDVLASLSRVLKGFVFGSVAGLAFGLLLGLSRWADRLLGPLFLAYRQIALFAWVPLLSMWFGGGEAGKLAFVTLSSFSPVVINTWRATRAIPNSLRELGAVLTFNQLDHIRLIALPGALPGIVTGIRSALIYAWLATVGAELFLDIAPGMGGRLNEGRDKFEVDLMLVALLVLAGLGLACSQVAALIEKRLEKWRTR
ncbi:MAG: binding-protein-dependent transport system inner rane component [Tardiphaga sp.]|jgi:sulfonate transport system permease protein|nr:binding-protein-dependent transport system inner rane component [Tardiphaga sp.]